MPQQRDRDDERHNPAAVILDGGQQLVAIARLKQPLQVTDRVQS